MFLTRPCSIERERPEGLGRSASHRLSGERHGCPDVASTSGLAPRTEHAQAKIREKSMAGDTTVKKIKSEASPHGEMDQSYLVSGKRVSLRLWQREKPQKKPATKRDYETVGYVISGEAELVIEGQTVRLEAGDSWLVPAGAEHAYRILSEFTAVEATAPPAHVHGRDS